MAVKFFTFDEIPFEKVNDQVLRRNIFGEKAMLTEYLIQKGAVFPEHHHPSEQITYVVKGAMLITIQGKAYTVRQRQVLVIPANVPHRAEALEDSLAYDIFSPVREDWLKKS